MRTSEDKGAIARAANSTTPLEVEDDGNLTLSVWLTQHTYYYGEPIKGLVSATVNVPDLAVIAIRSVLSCVIKRNTFSHGVHALAAFNETHDFLSGADLLTVETGEQEFRFHFSPDVFLPSFYSSIGSIKWSLAALATLSDGRVFRSSGKQGNFRMGCVYHPLRSIHPRVFTERKGWWSSQYTQVSLSKLVHDVGEPIIVKFSAAANHKDITINGVHIIQDVLLGDKKISVAVHSLLNPKIAESSYDSKQKIITDEFTMAMNEPTAACAVVYELTLRGKRISFPAPSMDIEIAGGEVIKISYRILMDFSIGTMMRAQKMLTLPFVVSDLCPPSDSLTNIRIMEPPTDKLPDYDKLSTKSKVGRPEAVAPHISAQLNTHNRRSMQGRLSTLSRRSVHDTSATGSGVEESTVDLMPDDRTSIATFDSQGSFSKGFFRTLSKKVPKKMSVIAHNAIDQLKSQSNAPERSRRNGSISSNLSNGDSDVDSTRFSRRQTVTLAELSAARESDDEEDSEHLIGADGDASNSTPVSPRAHIPIPRSPLATTRPRTHSSHTPRTNNQASQSRLRVGQFRRSTSNDTRDGQTTLMPPRNATLHDIPSQHIAESEYVRRRSSYMRNDESESVSISLPTYEEVVVSREGGLSAQRNWW